MGASWTEISYDVVWDVHFVNEGEGWYCNADFGIGSRIFHSVDGGLNWSNQLDTTGGLLAMDFVNEKVGIAVGLDGAIWKTDNGGDDTGVNGIHGNAPLSVVHEPGSDMIVVQSERIAGGQRITLFDYQGRTVIDREIQPGMVTRMPVSQLAEGAYAFRLVGPSGLVGAGRVVIVR